MAGQILTALLPSLSGLSVSGVDLGHFLFSSSSFSDVSHFSHTATVVGE